MHCESYRLRGWLFLAIALGVTLWVGHSADAAKAPHRYSPKHGAKCRTHYKRVKHRHKAYCVRTRSTRESARHPASVLPVQLDRKLHSHLDPTFTRDPLNPFKVTYAYSASASQEAAPQLRAVGVAEEPAPLPSGVLSLFSDGKLECAINVGGSATGSECPVGYQTLGSHTVTIIYTSGEQSATETEVEQIDPLATDTTLTVDYTDLPGGPVPTRQYVHCVNHPTNDTESCTYDYEWELGQVTELSLIHI